MIRGCAFGLALACAGLATAAAAEELKPIQPALDYHSFANIEQFRVTRFDLELRQDSFQKVLSGVVGLEIKRLDPGATQLILDTRDITVLDVTQKAQDVLGALSKTETAWVSRPFHLDRKDPILGQALIIELPPSKRPNESIRVEYETTPGAAALHWLSGAQTKHGPFLYTTSAPIGVRSWIPLQDTPQVRTPFKALIHTDSDVLAVMGAKSLPDAPGQSVRHNGRYSFEMTDAVPSSQVSLAVGNLKHRDTGPRSGVFAFGGLLKAAAAEFADTEAMIAAAEKMLGPYRWDRFDVAVMPADFAADDMAAPRVAFVSPATIAGDKSRLAAVADALAHGWSGQLVSNATWRDQWLNEAFSAYIGSRIIAAVYGERDDAVDRVLGLGALRFALAALKPADQALAVDLRDRDPRAADGVVQTEKGRLFLSYLEAKFGRERFDEFLRSYFDHFAFKSITTQQFERYLQENLLERVPGLVTAAQVQAWIDAPGLPADAVLPVTDAFAPGDAALAAWAVGIPAKKLPTQGWRSPQWAHFLDILPAPLAAAKMAELDQAFGFSRSPDAVTERSWFLLVIRSLYQPGYARLEDFLETNGNGKLVVPLYQALMQTPAGAVQAKRVYAIARPAYQSDIATTVDALVNPHSESEGSDE